VSYERLHYPKNLIVAPISDDEGTEYQLSPKAGVLWTPREKANFRAAYTRSLGGAFFDNSIRLEPTQVAGFNQAFRSVLPESAFGAVPASEFETIGIGFDWTAPTRTYFSLSGEWLMSDATRLIGAVSNSTVLPIIDTPLTTRQRLEYEEQSVVLTLNQLLGDEWALGARYRLTHANLEQRFIDVPSTAVNASLDLSATLHQAQFYALFHHPSGFFAQADTIWSHQSNEGYPAARPGDDFWQFNAYAGWRFLRRQAEARVGLLNITDQDYRLNPLTLYAELPRERTLTVSFRFYF
jgi:hypothetical protein